MQRIKEIIAFLMKAWEIWNRIKHDFSFSPNNTSPAECFENIVDHQCAEEGSIACESEKAVDNVAVPCMPQGIQTNFPLDALRVFGCYFFCLLRWAEIVSGKHFTNEDIIRLYNDACAKGLVNKDNSFVNNATALLNFLIGRNKYKDVKPFESQPDSDLYIIRLVKPGKTHFVLCHEGEIWDSLIPDRPAAAGYKPNLFREFI
jgi:hypothetical protein